MNKETAELRLPNNDGAEVEDEPEIKRNYSSESLVISTINGTHDTTIIEKEDKATVLLDKSFTKPVPEHQSWLNESSRTSITFFEREGSDPTENVSKSSESEPGEDQDNSTIDSIESESLSYRLSRVRLQIGNCVNNHYFQIAIVGLIVANAIMMGIATFEFVQENPSTVHTFDTIDIVFLSIFTAELSMQLLYHGVYLFKDGWLVFDFVLITASWYFSSLQIIRTFRIFRALRLVTRVGSLKKIVSALFDVMPKMAAITALLLLIFYIYGVMCTYLFKDLYERGLTDADFFSRLDITFLTLFQIMTRDMWGTVARQVAEVYYWSWMIFISYICITSFIVYNLVIAVVCDAVALIEREQDVDPVERLDEQHPKNLKRIKKLKKQMDLMTSSQTELLILMRDAIGIED